MGVPPPGTSPRCDASPLLMDSLFTGFPPSQQFFDTTHLYTWLEEGNVKLSFLQTHVETCLEPRPYHLWIKRPTG